jgi:hypothetical protein
MTRKARRGAPARLLVALALVLGALVAVPVTSSAAEPNVPQCRSRVTNEPLPQGDEAPSDCVGKRLLGFEAPTFPQVSFDEVLRFTWPAMCTREQTQSSPVKCVWRWKVQLHFYTEERDGSLQQLPYYHFRTEFASDDPGCDDIRNYCEYVVRADPAVPEDVVVVAGVYATSVFCNPESEFTGCNATDRPWMTVAQNVGEIQEPPPGGLDVALTATAPGGDYPLDGIISVAETTGVTLTLTNESEQTLADFVFAGGQPLVVDPRSTGGLEVVSGPTPAVPANLSLGPGEARSFEYEVEATREGIVAAHSRATAVAADGTDHTEAHSLRFDIADGIRMTREVGEWLRLQAMDALLRDTFGAWHDAMRERGTELAGRLSEIFTPERRLQWFGSETGLPLTPGDVAVALLRGTASEMVAALTPKTQLGGYTAEQLQRRYDATLKAEVGKGVSKYVKGWADLGASAKKLARDSWSEAVLAGSYVLGTATPEERAQWEAFAVTLVEGTAGTTESLALTIGEEIPKWRENGTYLLQAMEEMQSEAGWRGFWDSVQKVRAVVDEESAWREETLRLADEDPLAFQEQWAKRDAQIVNQALPIVFDTLIGGGVARGAGALKNVVVRGKGAAIIRTGKAAGVLDNGGNVVKGMPSRIEVPDAALPHGPSNASIAELGRSGAYLEDVEGATIVQSSDLGNVYELPNVGGVPETTIEAKAGILGSLEQEYFEKTGNRIRLAEVLKPSSPLRKPGGVAKTELTAQKTGKPAMLDAGAPRDVLAEANVWHGPDPRTLPGFDDLPKTRQKAAIAAYEDAEKGWAEYHNPTPGSKEARLKECVGQRARVPLDKEPNASGIQRFVNAEFEEVLVTEGAAEAKLIRVKYYEIEIVDTRSGRVLNRKTVVDVPEAAPQTPDADGVAMAKVVGTDPAGAPVLQPLDRAEREFVMQRYIDKNVKARRLPAGTPGAINDLAEHGVTLVMDDAGAKAAGFLLPRFGVPFLPEAVGMRYLKRIAPFVSAKNATAAEIEKMYRQMVEVVRSGGGFGQHAVVVTSDGRYLGEIPFESW